MSRIFKISDFSKIGTSVNYVRFLSFFFFTFRDCEMKLYSPTVNKFFSFFFYDGESRTQAVEFRFSIFARC